MGKRYEIDCYEREEHFNHVCQATIPGGWVAEVLRDGCLVYRAYGDDARSARQVAREWISYH